jgi:hypothetical protein
LSIRRPGGAGVAQSPELPAGGKSSGERIVEVGLERVRLGGSGPDVRWWLFVYLENARPQGPRRGVVDRGFRFARGGCCATEDEARRDLDRARVEARIEWLRWTHQPSHLLDPSGELIPLDEVLPELTA